MCLGTQTALKSLYTPKNTMSRAEVSKHYARLLSRWPTDRLRPEVQFRNLLRARIAAAPAIKQSSEQNEAQALPYSGVKHSKRDELKEVNAAYLLLDDTFAKQVGLAN